MQPIMIIHEPIQAAISFHLSHFEYGDAIFLAERLHAEVDSEESLYLLANCWFQSGKASSTYSLLTQRRCRSVQCRLLLAKACLEMRKYSEAEETLIGQLRERAVEIKIPACVPMEGITGTPTCTASNTTTPAGPGAQFLGESAPLTRHPGDISSETLVEEFAESAPYVARMLGQICARTDRNQLAISYLKRSLELNPFLWKSYEMLVDLGAEIDPATLFTIQSHNRGISTARGTIQLAGLCPSPPIMNPIVTPLHSVAHKRENSHSQLGLGASPGTLRRSLRLNSFGRGNNYSVKENTKSTSGAERIERAVKTPTKKQKRASTSSGPNSNNNNNQSIVVQIQRSENELNEINRNSALNILTEQKRDKEQKLLTSSKGPSEDHQTISAKEMNISEEENLKPDGHLIGRTAQLLPLAHPLDNLSITATMQHQRNSTEDLMDLLVKFGRMVSYLGQYNSDKVIEEVEKMTPRHRDTAYVLTCLGKAYFEQGKYEDACKQFNQARLSSPHHVVGMEYYSTAMWHLQREKQLSGLALEMIKHDKDSPQTWCVAGNCFSLQKEHETATKFLHRAIQLDPEFAYGYTLLGHELIATEEMDHAMACFRNAIRVDPRHYNAWYGIGMIYYKQEKYLQAEMHYKHALSISPNSPILMCHLGLVRHSLKKTHLALETLDRALACDPKNALCKFHRASLYFAQERYDDALRELEELREIVPKESLVYFLMGKVHKNKNNTHLALMNFSWAMDLDPKGANNQIKEMIDKHLTCEEEDTRAMAWADSSDP